MVNKWSLENEGFILGDFSSEPSTTKKISKRDPKTRHQRPQEEWTPADVASEFASIVYSKIRGVPGIVNTKALWGALAANRKRFGVTAVIELEAMERFFADDRTIIALRNRPKDSHKMFLNAITNNIQTVTEDLGMDLTSSVEFVYASDGTEFDNSMSGRLERDDYEKSLKEEN